MKRLPTPILLAAALIAAPLAGCENLPGTAEQQGAVGGGAGGAAAGAVLYEDNRALGALVGGLLGAGGGYLAGTQLDKDDDEARDAADEARRNPADVEDVRDAGDADLNGDGFVTMDELIAMNDAGLSGDEIVDRAEDTDQVFDLNPNQEAELIAAGYDGETLRRLERVNQDVRDRYDRENPDTSERISRPRS